MPGVLLQHHAEAGEERDIRGEAARSEGPALVQEVGEFVGAEGVFFYGVEGWVLRRRMHVSIGGIGDGEQRTE